MAQVTNRKCWNCGKKGHLRRNCKKPQKGSDGPQKASKNQGTKDDSQGAPKKSAGMVATTLGVSKVYDDAWVMDGGATAHMTSRRNTFSCLEPYSDTVVVGNGTRLPVKGKGEVWLQANLASKGTQMVHMQEVWYIPDLTVNLFSIDRAQELGAQVQFTRDGTRVIDSASNLVCIGKHHGCTTWIDAEENVMQEDAAALWEHAEESEEPALGATGDQAQVTSYATKNSMLAARAEEPLDLWC